MRAPYQIQAGYLADKQGHAGTEASTTSPSRALRTKDEDLDTAHSVTRPRCSWVCAAPAANGIMSKPQWWQRCFACNQRQDRYAGSNDVNLLDTRQDSLHGPVYAHPRSAGRQGKCCFGGLRTAMQGGLVHLKQGLRADGRRIAKGWAA